MIFVSFFAKCIPGKLIASQVFGSESSAILLAEQREWKIVGGNANIDGIIWSLFSALIPNQ